MQTSCIWTKIGWMSGGKSIDPCCVPEIFISARQKSNLGAQQRPTGQRCSAWFVHLQFAPKKVSLPGWTFIFFLRFISILIPKTRCPERIYGFFFCQVLVHLQLQSGQMKQTCGVIFLGLMCAHVFPRRWKHVENVQNMQNRRRLLSKVCLNACWLSMSSMWSLNLAGVRDQARWCTLLFIYFLFLSIGFLTMAICKIVCVCDLSVCVNLSSSHVIVMILTSFDLKNLGAQVNPELGTQLCCQSWQIAMSLEPWNSAVLWRPRMLRSCTPHLRHSDWAPKLESWHPGNRNWRYLRLPIWNMTW